MSYVSIAGLDKAEVLAALFNYSRQQGMGFIHSDGRAQMSVSQARDELLRTGRFDYLRGRVMKIDLNEEPMFTALYNRDNGTGSAERIIEGLRNQARARSRDASDTDTPVNPQAPWPTFTDDANGFETARPAPAPEPESRWAGSGGGGDFGGGGATSTWEAPAPSPSESCSASSYSSSDSGSSDSSSSSSSD